MAKKIKPSSTNPKILSDDITIELFSWFPIKSLMRFKCLSRYFNSIVSESYLVDIHQRRSMSTRLDEIKIFVQESEGFSSIEVKDDDKVSRCNFDFRYDHLSYANGLFCFWVEKLEPVRIFNPGTRELRLLPRLKQPYHLRHVSESNYLSRYYGCSYLLGYEPEGKKYKVLMTLYLSRLCARNLIFTLGTDKHWREIDHMSYFSDRRGICVSGVIYMLNNKRNPFIVALDLKAEKFKNITLWSASDYYRRHDYELIEVNGKIAVWDCSSKSVDKVKLLILRDTQKGKWQCLIISFPSELKNICAYKIYSCCDGEILIFMVRCASAKAQFCYRYEVRKDSWKYMKTLGDGLDKGIYTYVESLFPLKKVC